MQYALISSIKKKMIRSLFLETHPKAFARYKRVGVFLERKLSSRLNKNNKRKVTVISKADFQNPSRQRA